MKWPLVWRSRYERDVNLWMERALSVQKRGKASWFKALSLLNRELAREQDAMKRAVKKLEELGVDPSDL